MLFAAADWFNTWMTPLWLLGLGTLIGLAILLLIWLIISLVSRDGRRAVVLGITEGPLLPIFWTTVALAAFGIAGAFIVRDTGELLSSLQRVPFTGTKTYTVNTQAAPDDNTDPEPLTFQIPFSPAEVRSVTVSSNAELLVQSTLPDDEIREEPLLNWEVSPEEDFVWERTPGDNVFETEGLASVQVLNTSDRDAAAEISVMTAPTHPQANSVLVTAASVVGVYLLYFLLRWLTPKTSAIALATAKSEMASPLFLILLILGFFLLGLFIFIPYHTFGEDIKVLKDSGLTLIMVFAIFQAVWGASNSVAEEIDGKTALTVLSKPIGRRQFILGKFFGLSWSTLVMFVLLGVWLLIMVSYKPIYDARETANTAPTWQGCHIEMVRTIPGLVLAFMETLVFVAISVALSTRLPALANFLICFAIYAFGHLTPLLVQSSNQLIDPVRFIAKFIATILPVLDHFNIHPAVAAGVGVSYGYIGTAALYCFIYCTVAMLLALVLFEDRDLA